METKKQPNSFYLFKLAFGSAKFSGKRIFITLSLLSLFVAGSLYTANKLYKKTSFLANAPELNKAVVPGKAAPKSPVTGNKSKAKVKPFTLSPEYWQRRKQNGINRLSSQLQDSARRRPNRSRARRNQKVEERLVRHGSIITHPDEVAALKQDQPIFSEQPLKEDIPPPPKTESESGFWSELKKDFQEVMKDTLKKIFQSE